MRRLLFLLLLCLSPVLFAQSARKHVIAYVPYYMNKDLTPQLQAINWDRITDIDLAFINPPACDGICTASSDMTFGAKGHTDAEIDALIRMAHAKGIRVFASIGGGGGDQTIVQFYNVGLGAPLVKSLEQYVKLHRLDGVDVDVESPTSMGAPYADFVTRVVRSMHANGKQVSAAVAKYMQIAMPDATLHQFDFINVMVYSGMAASVDAMNFYTNVKNVPREKVVLGVPFYGQGQTSTESDYTTILAAYPNAWAVDTVGGGTLRDGAVLTYVGEATMAKEAKLGQQYGGVMIWHILGDAPAPHSLLDVIRTNLR